MPESSSRSASLAWWISLLLLLATMANYMDAGEWSAVGFVTGLMSGYETMLVCRTLRGFFEAGHWPCALAVTHAVLTRSDWTMGNSILQSGASLGPS